MESGCKKQKGDLHSDVLICEDHIMKSGPTSLLINEYVSSKILQLILGEKYFQPTNLVESENGEIQLKITKYDNFTPTKMFSEHYIVYWYFNNPNIPSASFIGQINVSKNLDSFNVAHDNTKYVNSTIGDTEITGFFLTTLVSRLVYDADTSNMENIGLVRDKNSYIVSRYDLDESFSYLYKSKPSILKKKPIEEVYSNPLSTKIMFSQDLETYIGFHQSSIAGQMLYMYTEGMHKKLIEKFSNVFEAHLLLTYNFQALPLEEAFINLLKHSITTINNIVADGFNDVKKLVPTQTAEKIYNTKSIDVMVKNPLKWFESYDVSYDFIKPQDVIKDPNVMKYCAKSRDNGEVNDIMNDISKIVQCMTAIKYTQIFATSLCYIFLKYKDQDEKIDDLLKNLPQPEVNFQCYYPNVLNSATCDIQSIFEITDEQASCFQDKSPIAICDLYGKLDVCQHSDDL